MTDVEISQKAKLVQHDHLSLPALLLLSPAVLPPVPLDVIVTLLGHH